MGAQLRPNAGSLSRSNQGETTLGKGPRGFFVHFATSGALMWIEPLAFDVLKPGPAIILGRAGMRMNS